MATPCARKLTPKGDRPDQADAIARSSAEEARPNMIVDARSAGQRRKMARYFAALNGDLTSRAALVDLIEAAADVDVSLHGVLRHEGGKPVPELMENYASRIAQLVGAAIPRFRHNVILEGVARFVDRTQASFDGALRELMADEGFWEMARRARQGEGKQVISELFQIRRNLAENKPIPEWAGKFVGLQRSMGMNEGLDIPLILDSERIMAMGPDDFFQKFHKGDKVRLPPRRAADGAWEDGEMRRWQDLNDVEQAAFKREFFVHWLGKETGQAARVASAGENAANARRFGIPVADEKEWAKKMRAGGVSEGRFGEMLQRRLFGRVNYLAREKALHDTFGAGSRTRDGYRVAESGDNLAAALDLVRREMGGDVRDMPAWSLGKQLFVQLRELEDPGAVFATKQDVALAEQVIRGKDVDFQKAARSRLDDLQKRQGAAQRLSGVSGVIISNKLAGRILNLPIEFAKSRDLSLIGGEFQQQGRAVVGGVARTMEIWFRDIAKWGVGRDDLFRDVYELAHGEVVRAQADLIAYGDDIVAASWLHKYSHALGVAFGGDSMNAAVLMQRKSGQLTQARALAIAGGTKRELLADADPAVRVWAHETLGPLRSEAWDAFVAARGNLGAMEPGLRAEVNGVLSVAAERDALYPTRMQRYGDLGTEYRDSVRGVLWRFAKAFTTSVSAGTGTGFKRHELKVQMGLVPPGALSEPLNARYVMSYAGLMTFAAASVYLRFARDGKGNVAEWDDDQQWRFFQRVYAYSTIGGLQSDFVAAMFFQLAARREFRPSEAALEARAPGVEMATDFAESMLGGAAYAAENGIDVGDASRRFASELTRAALPVNFPLVKGGIRLYISPYELESQETYRAQVAR